jgi:hypothetical protein
MVRFISSMMTALAVASVAAEYEQLPGHFGGFGSDGVAITVADDFRFAENTLVDRITWWGGYFNPPAADPDNFVVRIFGDDNGRPGSLFITIPAGAADKVATGRYVNPGLYPEFRYSVSVSFLAEGGYRFWISIVNPASPGSWLWEASSNSIANPGVQRSFNHPVTGPWEPYTDDTAFAFRVLPILDSDRDGVPDTADRCPDTPAGAVVDPHGCSVEQRAPCDGPWRNHGDYVSAVARAARAFAAAGLITAKQQRDLINAAAKSDCGKSRNLPVARENRKGHRILSPLSPNGRLPRRR